MVENHKGKILEHLVINNKKMTAIKIAEAMGISRTTLYKWFNREDVPDDIIRAFCKATGIKEDVFQGTQVGLTNVSSKGVPVLNVDFSAGVDVAQYNDFPERVIGHIDLNGFRSCVAFVTVKGNSMFPVFTAGDLVGLEPQEDTSIIEFGNPFAIVTKGGLRLIKKIVKGKDKDHLILRSNNKEYDDIDINKKDIYKLYKVRGPVRDSFQ